MPVQLSKGIAYAANENITNTKLHSLVDNGTLLPGAISEQVVQSPPLATADSVLFLDASIPALTQLQLNKFWAEPMQIGQTNKVTADFALVSAPVAQFASATIPSLVGVSSITGTTPAIAKAWVNFNGSLATNGNPQTTSSTSFVGTTITANFAAAHGLVQGDSISIFAQTGNSTVLNGTWTVASAPSSTSITFVVTSTPAGALAAAVPIHKVPIRASYNVSSVGVTSGGVVQGRYIINFSSGVFSDSNYCAVVTGVQVDSATLTYSIGIEAPVTSSPPTLYTATQCQVLAQASNGGNTDISLVNFVAFR